MDELLDGTSALRMNVNFLNSQLGAIWFTLSWSCPSSVGCWQSEVDSHYGREHPELSLHTTCQGQPEAFGSPWIHNVMV